MPQVSIRTSSERLAVIDRAAAIRGVSRTEFVLRSSEAAAIENPRGSPRGVARRAPVRRVPERARPVLCPQRTPPGGDGGLLTPYYAAHTRSLEAEATRQEASAQRWGRGVAATVAIAILATCLYALHLDKEDFATTLGSWTIVALAAVFVAGKVPEWIGRWGP